MSASRGSFQSASNGRVVGVCGFFSGFRCSGYCGSDARSLRPAFRIHGGCINSDYFFPCDAGSLRLVCAFCGAGIHVGAFGQIPINDYMIGRMAKSELRASIFGARYIVSFVVWATVVPLIAWVHHNWGFDVLFYILAGAAILIFLASHFPRELLDPQARAPRKRSSSAHICRGCFF